jgi:lysyl-tRNA synthetase class 2
MLHPIPGGASARPFETYHNTLKSKFYLRVAPELYLKKLIVGGFDKVFEINRNFRNEGISYKHNPEFTMLEFYQAYSTHEDLMVLTEVLLMELVFSLFSCYTLTYKGSIISFKQPFSVITFKDSIIKYNSQLTLEKLCCRQYLIKVIKDSIDASVDISLIETTTLHDLQVLLFDLTVEKNLIQPTFIVEYPIEVSPLAKRNAIDSTLADRFELFIGGFEIANGFSELTDPVEQKKRFEQQAIGKTNSSIVDADSFCDYSYIECLEYGMPPTAGEGIGIDRLAMLFTDSTTIKDVILFPV